ncbi:hypothetical protein V6N12_019083 [Hibiscus sabdariffa]|uniref:Transposase MuDR plant domain-containing protein n=1 Tax=Hibiscus sabdariffa TaxID=183260 RepID=A0ABR2B9W7_9ROSI
MTLARNSDDESASVSHGLVDVVVVEGCIVGGGCGDRDVNIDVSYGLENDVDVDGSETDSFEEEFENLSDDGDEEMQEIWGKARELGAKVKRKTVTTSDVTPELNFKDFPSKVGRGKRDDRKSKHVDADLEGCLSGSETEHSDSSDSGSYKSDSDAEVVCQKSKHALYASTPAPTFHLGMIFDGPVQFRDALAAYAISKGFDIKYKRNESSRIRARCKAEGCPFEIFAGVDNRDGFFKIKTLVNDHSCSITFRNTRASYKFVGKHFLHILRVLPRLKLREMQRLAKEELNLDLNRYVCGRARKWAVEQIQGRIKFEFSRLFDYVFALRDADPSANIELMSTDAARSATMPVGSAPVPTTLAAPTSQAVPATSGPV